VTSIGYASLLLALLAALGSALAAAWGARVRHSQWVRHAEKGLLVVAGLLAFATAGQMLLQPGALPRRQFPVNVRR